MNAPESPAAYWDQRYEAVEELWPRDPNVFLAEFAAGLSPGRALDLGAGEGRNAIWLAKRGWRVTALDVSAVALGRAAQRAAEEGVGLDCVEADWRDHRPGAPIELAIISFMHPETGEQPSMFERAGEALAPGGHLFVTGVDLADHGRRGPPDPDRLHTPQRLRRALRGFDLVRCESVAHETQDRQGRRSVVDVVAIATSPGPAAPSPR